jgi:hypothetical protein
VRGSASLRAAKTPITRNFGSEAVRATTKSPRVYRDAVGTMPHAKSPYVWRAQMQDQFAEWTEIGVDHELFDQVARIGVEGRRDAARMFAEATMPAFPTGRIAGEAAQMRLPPTVARAAREVVFSSPQCG